MIEEEKLKEHMTLKKINENNVLFRNIKFAVGSGRLEKKQTISLRGNAYSIEFINIVKKIDCRRARRANPRGTPCSTTYAHRANELITTRVYGI